MSSSYGSLEEKAQEALQAHAWERASLPGSVGLQADSLSEYHSLMYCCSISSLKHILNSLFSLPGAALNHATCGWPAVLNRFREGHVSYQLALTLVARLAPKIAAQWKDLECDASGYAS